METKKSTLEETKSSTAKVGGGDSEDTSSKPQKKGLSSFAKVGIVLAIFLILVGAASVWYYTANPAQESSETEQQSAAASDSDDESKTAATTSNSNSSTSSKSSSSSSSSSNSNSKSSSSQKSYSYDDDYDYSYSSSSSKSSASDRRQTYAHTYDDGWSYMEYNDGSAEITDGWGMVARDTDGDGELDKISTDSGETWEDFE